MLTSVVKSLLADRQYCVDAKTSKGWVSSRHSTKAMKLFASGAAPDYEDIQTSKKFINVPADSLLPAVNDDSSDEESKTAKSQKIAPGLGPSSPKEDSDDED